MDSLNSYMVSIDLINNELAKLDLLDAFIVFDAEKNIVEEFYRDYLNEIDLSFFREKLDVLNDSTKQILLTEKGMIFVYKSLAHNFVLLAGFRESTDIYNLQSQLDIILP